MSQHLLKVHFFETYVCTGSHALFHHGCWGMSDFKNPSISSDVGSKLPPSAFSTRHPWRSEADGSTSASGTSPLVQSHGLDKNDHPSGVTLSMGFSKGGC